MGTEDLQRKSLKRRLLSCVAAIALIGNTMAPFSTAVAQDSPTLTPIKHVIVIIGENRTFDHIFATYKPVNKGEKVLNLLSKGIVKVDGTPGPNYGEALQYHADDFFKYNPIPPKKAPYDLLPPALTGGPGTPYGCQLLGIGTSTSTPPTECDTPANEAALKKMNIQPIGLPNDYYKYLLTGGTGQASKVPDARIDYNGHEASQLPPGPFQITSKTFPYDSYAASPVHRFYQMWQSLDCDAAAADKENGWGCKSDLFPLVETATGVPGNGKARPSPFTDLTTGEGST
jgi:phospholipase C